MTGRTVQLEPGALVVLVGPNNSGKSLVLRNILDYTIRRSNLRPPFVLTYADVRAFGSVDELWEVLTKIGLPELGGEQIKTIQGSVPRSNLTSLFSEHPSYSDIIGSQFVRYLDAASRLNIAQDVESPDFGTQPKTSPLHYLHQSRELRRKLNDWCKRAFGIELAVDRWAGSVIRMYCGIDAEQRVDEDDEAYRDRIRKLSPLVTEGDGVKSFVGTLLHSILLHQSIHLIDEPEAFLHPPQARLLGRLLAQERQPCAQVFIATHSADVLKGILDANTANITVLRIQRNGTLNRTTELGAETVHELLVDPVLRYSNVLDGIFHEKVIIAEADGDCRFYASIADALREKLSHAFRRDVLFLPSGGKSGIPKMLRALHKLGISVATVADFDLLRDVALLRAILQSVDAEYHEFLSDINTVRAAIDAKGRTPIATIKTAIVSEIQSVADDALDVPASIATRIRKLLGRQMGWQLAKSSGLNVLSPGSERVAGERLLTRLQEIGIFIVPTGELESFCPNIPFRKSEWVNDVLTLYASRLSEAVELEPARQFVSRLIA